MVNSCTLERFVIRIGLIKCWMYKWGNQTKNDRKEKVESGVTADGEKAGDKCYMLINVPPCGRV